MPSKTTPTRTRKAATKATPKRTAKAATRKAAPVSQERAKRNEQIRADFEAGMTTAQVAAKHMLGTARVSAIRRKLGLDRPAATVATWQSDEQRDLAHAATQQLADIGTALGISPARVLKRVEREAQA